VVFAVIAMREVEFFLEVAARMRAALPGLQVAFISFFQPGRARIAAAGFRCYDLYEYAAGAPASASAARFGIDNPRRYILHEKITFDVRDDAVLERKLLCYLDACERILQDVRSEFSGRAVVMQELGGFIAPLSLYFACRRAGLEHVFFEPSFFRGMVLAVRNSLAAVSCGGVTPDQETRRAAGEAIAAMAAARAPIVPDKDRHHFADMGLRKIFSSRNAARLLAKLEAKYLRRERQEYEHIGTHVRRAFSMLLNRRLNDFLYEKFDPAGASPYVYFPFHVRLDYSLTVRNPEYLDQLRLVDYLCDILPSGYRLLVKEHPASIGGFGFAQLRRLARAHPNLRILHPATPGYEIIHAARAVITVNSKVGAEALLQGKAVIALGNAVYAENGVVTYVDNLAHVERALLAELARERPACDAERRHDFFVRLYAASYPGELYNREESNLRAFSASAARMAQSAAPVGERSTT
jgi:hypothetical protein